MAKQGHFGLEFSEETISHLKALAASQRSIVRDGIEQLRYEPLVATRNRRPMRPSRYGRGLWELRLGELRVYYEVEGEVVVIRAIGIKEGNRVRIDREVIEL
jgi:mRNA-degrading endonuclease RelE of RelBE toxin-antitoxin system